METLPYHSSHLHFYRNSSITFSVMKHLFKKVKVVLPTSSYHGKQVDILICNGKVRSVANNIESDDATVIERDGLYVSAGWVDLMSNFMDPGHEYKETISSGLDAAAAGGFTHVAVLPSTVPVIDSSAQINDITKKAQHHAVELLPIGCITKGLEQQSLAEIYDMDRAGAVAFCDGKEHIHNADLMRIAMEYAVGIHASIWSFPKDRSVAGRGYMNEGPVSTMAGIKGTPGLAEELAVGRDIQLSGYTGCPVHFPMISTAGSVELVRKAQEQGLKVTAGVSSYHLMFSETDLKDLDTNLKTDHPLRSPQDREALKQAVNTGVVSTIVSDHTPQDHEAKVLEFGHAAYGMINLQTSFAMANSAAHLDVDKVIGSLTTGPREVLGMDQPILEEGCNADLTFFCPEQKWIPTVENNRSRSVNSPVIGNELTGKPIAVACGGAVIISD